MKNFRVKIQHHLIANIHHTVDVRANTERNAEKLAVEKASKETGCKFHRMDVKSVTVVD